MHHNLPRAYSHLTNSRQVKIRQNEKCITYSMQMQQQRHTKVSHKYKVPSYLSVFVCYESVSSNDVSCK